MLVRADLNVPMADGKVTDNLRIMRQAPTIRELAEKGARVIVLSHFDRPKGKVVPSMSLKPVAEPLARELGRPVAFVGECVHRRSFPGSISNSRRGERYASDINRRRLSAWGSGFEGVGHC